MATAASANTNSSSPRHMNENLGSPTAASTQSRRTATRPVSFPPWNQIVRGESEPIAAAAPSSPQSRIAIEQIVSGSASASAGPSAPPSPPAEEEKSENSGGSHCNAGKKPAWNRPSNGAAEVGAVMGAAAWPALSESTKAPSSRSSSDSLKSLSDGSPSSSLPVPQGTGIAFVPTQKQPSSNANSNSMPNHSRQRSFKRNGASSSTNGNLLHPPAPGSVSEVPLHSPSRGHNQRNGFVAQSQSHGGNDNQLQRNSFRNQNGNHHQNHGGRRNQEHGNQNWNPHRNYNGRDGHIQPQRGFPGFMRHPAPPISGPFMPLSPMQPFTSPVGYPEVASPVYYPPSAALRGVPLVAPMPASFFYHVPDPPLFVRIQNQIHFYFSEENLIRDVYLRQNMDYQGWVQIQLIAGFKKVSELTDNIQLILDALQNSSVVEVQGDKIRKRNDWMRWLIPHTVPLPNVSSPRTAERAEQNMLATHVQNLSLELNTTDQSVSSSHGDVKHKASASCSSSCDSNNHQQLLTDDAAGSTSAPTSN